MNDDTPTLTADQIARQTGLSNATVSRVLNNSTTVSDKAREAVLAIVRDNGGVMPRLLGPRGRKAPTRHSLSGSLVRILHVVRFPIVPIQNPKEPAREIENAELPQSKYFSPEARLATSFSRHIIEGIIEELRNFDMRAVVQVAEDLRSRQLLNELNGRDNRGLFLLGIHDSDVDDLIDRCKCPVVSLMSWEQNGWPDYVGIDNAKGIRLAFEHVKRLGHTRIGYVAGELKYSLVFRERLAAFKTCVIDAGLEFRPDWVSEGSCNTGPIEAGVDAILRRDDRPTAMLCSFDGAAIGIKRAADKIGLRIPVDLSVVGFDDEEIAQLFSPPLTTVHVPTVLMGRQAVQLMMMRLQRPIERGEGCSLRVTPTLVERQSAATVGKAAAKSHAK